MGYIINEEFVVLLEKNTYTGPLKILLIGKQIFSSVYLMRSISVQ